MVKPIKANHQLTGGIHLADNKSQSAERSLQSCPLPELLMVPLTMHAGVEASLLVEVGDEVNIGQAIAEAAVGLSTIVHSPADGIVKAIEFISIANRSGLKEQVVIINCHKQQSLSECYSSNWEEQSPDQLLETIRLAGIVGLGGAGFPSFQKLHASRSDSHTLLLNGAECEPYISCDDRTMRDFSEQVIEGALILSRSLDCNKIQVVIEDNKPQAIKCMAQAIDKYLPKSAPECTIDLIEIPTRYPSGGERQLIEIVTGKQIPSGRFPASLGYTVQNVGTAAAVYDALVLNKPLIDRIVTVTGDAVEHPGNYRVSIGTPIRHLLNVAGWDENQCQKIIHGGPMMGYPLNDTDRPIGKTTNCIIAASEKELPVPLPEQSCIRCGKCAEVCPASLLPQQLLWFSKSAELEKATDSRLMDCIECGACAYVCPSQIPLVDYYRFTKAEIRNKATAKVKSDRSKQRFDFRNQRLENAKLEKQRLRAEKKKKSNLEGKKKQAVADALARVQAKKAKKISRQSTDHGAEAQNDE